MLIMFGTFLTGAKLQGWEVYVKFVSECFIAAWGRTINLTVTS